MLEFIRKILPAQGYYCVARALYNGKFAHTFWETPENAYANIIALEKAGHTVYLAQSSFLTTENRKHPNVQAVRSFWLDIDCGDDKPYATQIEGIKALKAFCTETEMPIPAIVNSGNGLYAHWTMFNDIIPAQWKGVATNLKALCDKYGFQVDESRTSDESSVLRPVGSFNKKSTPKPVKLIYDAPPMHFDEFCDIIKTATEKAGIKTQVFTPPATSKLNDEFSAGLNESFESNADLVAQKCLQIGLFKSSKGNISEPLWYAGIGVLRFTTGGSDLIHEWSSGHPEYSITETHKKIEQHTVPPTTCHHFGALNPNGCVGCVHNGKIKTPLVLGRVYNQIEIESDRTEIPKGFILTDAGILTREDNQRVYPYDIYPVKLAYDETLGYEVVTIEHKTPHGTVEQFGMRSSLVHDPKAFLIELHDNHVQVTGADSKKLMVMFMEQYIEKLRARKKMIRLFSQMGWQEYGNEQVFVLGDSIYKKHDTPNIVGYARNVPEVVKSYSEKGNFSIWKSATGLLNKPELAAHAFMFVVGAFGAPLLKFTGYSGAMVSAIGSSGAGKSLMQYMIQSVYGDYRKLVMIADDTNNALISRLGVCGSMPMTIDEVTNLAPFRVSELAYRITQGRDKIRLTKSAVEKTNINSWQTLAVVSSNSSLTDKLATLKGDASAEINRIFEFYVPSHEDFIRQYGTYIHSLISENYGHAGKVYIQYLIDNYDAHATKLKEISDKIHTDFKMRNEERFWSAVMAVAIYGGLIAKKLNLIDIDVVNIYKWFKTAVASLRSSKQSAVIGGVDLIGEFLDTYAANVVIIGKGAGNASYVGYKVPINSIVARYETHTGACFISRSAFAEFLAKRYMSMTTVLRELEAILPRSPLIERNKRKVLTSGLSTVSSAAIYTLEIDLKHPVFGNTVMELVNNTTFKENKEIVNG